MMRLRQSPWIRTKDRRRMVESLMRKRMRLVVGVEDVFLAVVWQTMYWVWSAKTLW